MKIILLGIQGSGKSTQGNLLHKKFGIPYLSTGHIFREIAKEHSSVGRYIKEVMNAGYLIPDDRTLEIVAEYLKRPEYKKGYILDGFPRTVNQAESFTNGIDRAIYLKVSDREALWRLSLRNDEVREDETIKAIHKRIGLFHEVTEPVLEYYKKKGLLTEIDGEQPIEQIHEEILDVLKDIKNGKKLLSRPMHPPVIAIVGMAGSGKSEAAQLFRNEGMEVLRLGTVIEEGLKEQGLAWTVENDAEYRRKIREEIGMDAIAIKMLPRIQKALTQTTEGVILDGLYSWEEYVYFQKHLSHLTLLCIYARPSIRYERLGSRKVRPYTKEEARQRDIQEIVDTNKGGPIAIADYLIKNETTKEEFQFEFEKFLTRRENI